jgi:hypothetical protein
MRYRALLLSLAVGSALCADFPELSQVQNVYLLPMSGGLDQYLAKSLTQNRQYHVVTDPKAADAIFTDRLGEHFEKKLLELYPPPPPPREKPAAKNEKDNKDDRQAGNDKEMLIREEPNVRVGGFSRNRGNVFLVDRTSKTVLWSFYKRPKSTAPDDMHQTANAIVSELKRDVVGKKK